MTYNIRCPNGKVVQVCKKLFLSTFDLGEWTVLGWVKENGDGYSHGMAPSKEVVVTKRRLSNPQIQNKNIDGKEILRNFIESLPKLPSHYCRKNTNKVYLEPVFGDIMLGVYNEYKRICREKEGGPVQHISKCGFDNYISKMSLTFQQPKKDCCDDCIMFEVGHDRATI